MMRNTSPVGWIPLLAYKVLFEGALIPFIISGLFVALPIIFGCIYADTIYYGGSDWVITSLNFLQVNLTNKISDYFGQDPFFMYIVYAAAIFTVLLPLAFYATFINHIQVSKAKQVPAYLSHYTIFYIGFFSLIVHKEMRFLLPILPFMTILLAQLLV